MLLGFSQKCHLPRMVLHVAMEKDGTAGQGSCLSGAGPTFVAARTTQFCQPR
jgi:homoserine kinase